MSKSILVIDTPETCVECEFLANRLCGKGRCILNKDTANVISDKGKPDWCPLKEAPKKYKTFSMNFERGYNACVDEILKERDEK